MGGGSGGKKIGSAPLQKLKIHAERVKRNRVEMETKESL